MKTKEALLGVLGDARGWLKNWSDGFTAREALDSGGSPANPLAWQLAHVACTQDDVIRLFSGGRGVVPESLRALCGSGSPPPTKRTKYPSLPSLWRLLDRTQKRLAKMVRDASEKDLDRPPHEENAFFTSLGQAVYEIALHETYHVGMVATLRKAHKKPSV
jgi:hypothetical protein